MGGRQDEETPQLLTSQERVSPSVESTNLQQSGLHIFNSGDPVVPDEVSRTPGTITNVESTASEPNDNPTSFGGPEHSQPDVSSSLMGPSSDASHTVRQPSVAT